MMKKVISSKSCKSLKKDDAFLEITLLKGNDIPAMDITVYKINKN
jgi:hypothetical protein